jgi:hypothetical protein
MIQQLCKGSMPTLESAFEWILVFQVRFIFSALASPSHFDAELYSSVGRGKKRKADS